jgi:hypothetical protein
MCMHGVPVGALNLSSVRYQDHGRCWDLPLQGIIPMVEPGIEPGASLLVVRSSDHQATTVVLPKMLTHTQISGHFACSFTCVYFVETKDAIGTSIYRKPWFTLKQFCLKFLRFQIRRSVRITVVPIEVSCGFLQSLQESAH